MILRSAGDPATPYIQRPEAITPTQYQLIVEKYHLDEPVYVQYIYWLGGVLEGDLGYSQVDHRLPVTTVIANRFPATFELALLAMFFSVGIGIFLGTISAVRANKPVDHATRLMALIAVSIPVFWLGVIFQYLFGYDLEWLPIAERYSKPPFDVSSLNVHTNFLLIDTSLSGNWNFFVDVLQHLIMPAVALTFVSTALIIRIMRSSMLEVLGMDYVQTARSKGLPEKIVIKKHARRNALIPTTTVVGLSFGALLGGAVLTETVFSWPGLGQWSALAATNLDTAGIMGFVILTAIIYVLANLTVDIVYAYLDPRVRLG